jgi:hypothetical protein
MLRGQDVAAVAREKRIESGTGLPDHGEVTIAESLS